MSLLDSLLAGVERLLGGSGPGYKLSENTYVAVVNRDSYRIFEGKRSVEINAELSQHPNRIIYSSSVRSWEPPYSDDTFDNDDRSRLIAILCDYFQRQGTSYEIK